MPPDNTDRKPEQNTLTASAGTEAGWTGGLRERTVMTSLEPSPVMGYQYHSMLYNKWKERKDGISNNGEHSLIKN